MADFGFKISSACECLEYPFYAPLYTHDVLSCNRTIQFSRNFEGSGRKL